MLIAIAYSRAIIFYPPYLSKRLNVSLNCFHRIGPMILIFSYKEPSNENLYSPQTVDNKAKKNNCRTSLNYNKNKKAQLSLTNPRDACEKFARFK